LIHLSPLIIANAFAARAVGESGSPPLNEAFPFLLFPVFAPVMKNSVLLDEDDI